MFEVQKEETSVIQRKFGDWAFSLPIIFWIVWFIAQTIWLNKINYLLFTLLICDLFIYVYILITCIWFKSTFERFFVLWT